MAATKEDIAIMNTALTKYVYFNDDDDDLSLLQPKGFLYFWFNFIGEYFQFRWILVKKN